MTCPEEASAMPNHAEQVTFDLFLGFFRVNRSTQKAICKLQTRRRNPGREHRLTERFLEAKT